MVLSTRLSRTARAVYQQTLAWLFCATYIPMMVVLLLGTLGQFKPTLGSKLMRGWGKGMLWISGVRLAIDDNVKRELAQRRARVMTFNHCSTLDLFVGAALVPEGATIVVKKELRYLPLIGQVILLLDVVFIDRKNRQRATDSLRAAGARLREGQHTAIISPEGTRSPAGTVGEFKMGPFHLAVEAQVPLVPLVWHGCADLYPRDAIHCRPGVVRVSMLPELPTAGRSAADVRALADEVRAGYAAALGFSCHAAPHPAAAAPLPNGLGRGALLDGESDRFTGAV